MYRVAFNNGKHTENYFFMKKKNAQKKMEEICGGLSIKPIRLNEHLTLAEGFITYHKIETNDKAGNGNFFIL